MYFFKSWLKKERKLNFWMNQQVSKNYQDKKILKMVMLNHNQEQIVKIMTDSVKLMTLIGMKKEMTLLRMRMT